MAAPTVVQSSTPVNVAASSATVAPTLAGVVAGNLLALWLVDTTRTSGYAATGVAGGGATWYRGPSLPSTAGVGEWWYGIGGTGGSITVTATMTGSDTAGGLLFECSGCSAQPAIEYAASITATTTGTNPTLSPQPVNLNDLILVGSLSANTQTGNPASPYATYAGPTTAGAQKAGCASWVTNTLTANAVTWTATSGVYVVCSLVLKASDPWGYSIENSPAAATNPGVLYEQSYPDWVDSVVTADAALGYGVLTGCAVSPNTGTDLKFQVSAGTALFGWGPLAVAAATAQAITAADGTNPRRDLVYVNFAGTVKYLAGAAAIVPCPPTLPAQAIALGFIDVPANATQLDVTNSTSQAHVIDKRVLLGFPPELRDYYLMASGALAETLPYEAAQAATLTPVSATLYLSAIVLPAGLQIGHIAFLSSGAAGTPTNYWFCLEDNNRNLLAITADATSTAWAGNTIKSLAIATTAQGAQSTFITTYTGLYYLGFMMKASTVSALCQANFLASANVLARVPILAGSTGTNNLTTPLTFPTQTGAITGGVGHFYGYVAA
jgi:hypothetical protein